MRLSTSLGLVMVAAFGSATASPSAPKQPPKPPPLDADGGILHRIAAEVAVRVDAMIASHGPKLVPPVPVDIKWKPVRLGSFDFGAPLVALAAADLDGDGKAELYAVTSHEVIVIAMAGRVP